MIDESLVNSETHNTETEEKARMVEKPEDAVRVVQEFVTIVRTNKTSTVWIA